MTVTFKNIAAATTLLCMLQTGQVFAQALPWQNGQQPSPQPQNAQQHQRHVDNNVQPPQFSSAPQSDQRTLDDRRLNELATQFYKAKPEDKHIIGELKSILKDVKAFHAELLNRTYNAVDIIRDTENLEGRVSKQLGHLEAEAKKSAATPAAAK